MTAHRFQTHYTREQARALFKLRQWLGELVELRSELEKTERRLAGLMTAGQDTGGKLVNQSIKVNAVIRQLLQEFENREIFD